MTRLIDADALKKAFYNQECWSIVIEHIIASAPTVETRPQGECVTCKYRGCDINEKPCQVCSRAYSDLYQEEQSEVKKNEQR